MRDFTLNKFEKLIMALKNEGYSFQPYFDFIQYPKEKIIILRHDVDLLPLNSLATAEVENSLEIKGSYYFRSVPESYDVNIIRKIASLGHEVGYHYETVDKVSSERGVVNGERGTVSGEQGTVSSERGVVNGERGTVSGEQGTVNGEQKTVNDFIDRAYELFVKELKMFRDVVDVKTVCMHGSPRGKYDNKLIWTKYNYKDLGILGEPYLDIDWNEFGYLTDTGRRWNGDKYSLRDKVNSKYKFDFKSTDDIINNVDKLPNKLMITVHPQRWTDNPVLWTRELVWQNVKNVVKRYMVNSKR